MQDDTAYGVSFVSLPGMAAIEVIDPIERHRYRLETPADVRPESTDPDQFRFPVDRAVTVTTDAFSLPSVVTTIVRTRDGTLIAEAEHDAAVRLPADDYVVEVCSPIKLYLEFEAPIQVTSDHEGMALAFDEPTTVAVGARSAHKQPEATVTTTADPTDMMRAVSTFSSALKTTSPERSFPTLRGHPPRVELGDTLDIPSVCAPPETGITIELTPRVEEVFTAATLAYYLGARLEPADRNALCVDGDIVLELGTGTAFRDAVENTLKHTFLLDCVVRTEGLYPVPLHERSRVSSLVDLDLATMYELPIGPRLQRYLTVPFDAVRDVRPRWGLAAHMLPDPSHVELLPYVVDDLALVQVHRPGTIDRPADPTEVVSTAAGEATAFTRSTAASAPPSADFVCPPQTACLDQLWIGDGTPIGASKAIPEAFEHRLTRAPTDSSIDITVVCNDERMNEERGVLDESYGARDDVQFDVTVQQDLTCDALAAVLAEDTDFFHYIGHIDDDGLECTDGKLDAASLDEVGVSAFLLNACQSYRQGRHLIEHGAIGGIVTLSEVINEGAVRIGGTLAKTLNLGFPLYAALNISRQESIMGGRYIVVGDGRVALAQPKSIPHLHYITRDPHLHFSYTTFPTKHRDLGSLTIPFLTDHEEYFLVSSTVESLTPTRDELLGFFGREEMPVYIDGELTWSNEIDAL